MNKLNINSWIAAHYNIEDFDERLKSVNNSLEFLWIWTIFEREIIAKGLVQRDGNMEDKIISSLRGTQVSLVDIQAYIDFFKKRYFDCDNKPTKYLKALNFSNKYFNDLKCVLVKGDCSLDIKLRVLVLIAYRFRCNLFHGGKDPLLWRDFEDVFLMIMQLLILIIDNQDNSCT